MAALGIFSYCDYTHTPEPNLKKVLSASLATVWNEDMGRGTTLVDTFTEKIVNAVSMNEARFFFRFKEGILWFQLSTAFDFWMRQRRSMNLTTLDRDAIRLQLIERYMSKGSKGQYIVDAKVIEGCWCYGIDLKAATSAGLDIPSDIHLSEITIHMRK